MPRYDFRTPRLFVEGGLAARGMVSLSRPQANYLLNVLRLKAGDPVLAFNGRDGEWGTALTMEGKRDAALQIDQQLRAQTPVTDLHFLFAPLKHARLDYMVQKAVEMGVSHLQPTITRHTQVTRVNLERMQANAIEAAEQCGVLTVPTVGEPQPLDRLLAQSEPGRLFVFCDEDAETRDPLAALAAARPQRAPSFAVLIGPEGGFAPEERAMLLKRPNVLRIALGPRILRADTAAVAALTVVQAVLGDWQNH